MKYKLVAADMDGTLLNDRSELSGRTKAAIIGAVEAGAIFVTATGRPLIGAGMINSLIKKDMPVIIFNGAAAFMWRALTNLFSIYLDAGLAKEVYDASMEIGVPAVVWTGKGMRVNRVCEATLWYRDLYNIEMGVVENIYDLEEEGIYKLLWLETPETVSRLQKEMSSRFQGRLICHSSRPTMLEFVNLEAEKGSAMAAIGKLYGVDRSEMIAIGDGYNDISMLKYAGLGVAMDNAPPDVKAACANVAPGNNEDGAAIMIEKYILGL